MYLEQLKTSILAILVLSVVTGLGYPLAMTGLSKVLFPVQAEGSLIMKDGKPLGSHLIGQPFDDPKYFWSRISATSPAAYNASNSSGSNLGPLNPALLAAVQGRIDTLKKADPNNRMPIPVDLVTSSASGLDPHITPAAALYQVGRVARLRGLSESEVKDLIRRYTESRFGGLLGEPTVHVLELNLALDARKP